MLKASLSSLTPVPTAEHSSQPISTSGTDLPFPHTSSAPWCSLQPLLPSQSEHWGLFTQCLPCKNGRQPRRTHNATYPHIPYFPISFTGACLTSRGSNSPVLVISATQSLTVTILDCTSKRDRLISEIGGNCS